MDESFSRTGFLYGMAFVLATSKARTLLIWRTLPKPRPPLQQELIEAWHRRRWLGRRLRLHFKISYMLAMMARPMGVGPKTPSDQSYLDQLSVQTRLGRRMHDQSRFDQAVRTEILLGADRQQFG